MNILCCAGLPMQTKSQACVMCRCLNLIISCRVLRFAGNHTLSCTVLQCYAASVRQPADDWMPNNRHAALNVASLTGMEVVVSTLIRQLPQRQQPTMLRSLAASIAALMEAATLGLLVSAPPMLRKNCCRCASFC